MFILFTVNSPTNLLPHRKFVLFVNTSRMELTRLSRGTPMRVRSVWRTMSSLDTVSKRFDVRSNKVFPFPPFLSIHLLSFSLDSIDCGVFAMMAAFCVVHNIPLCYNGLHTEDFRMHIAASVAMETLTWVIAPEPAAQVSTNLSNYQRTLTFPLTLTRTQTGSEIISLSLSLTLTRTLFPGTLRTLRPRT
jgi:hypothetical protein